MSDQELEQAAAELDREETELREQLKALEEVVHDKLLRDASKNHGRIASAERQIHRIVLRLVEIERERTDLRIAKALR